MEIAMTEFKSFFKSVAGNEGDRCHYNTRLDTYGCGCQHNCAYCYARSLLDFRGLWNPASPAVADIKKIRRTIERRLQPGDVVRLGGMTDCFMPIERKYGVTAETIKALNERGVHYLIVTKSPLVAEYLDILDTRLAHIQVSITSTDDEVSRRIEPGAALPEARIKAVERLTEGGADCQVRLSPFIPQFVNIDRINAIKCDRVLVEFLRVNTWIAKWLNIDLGEYTFKNAGYRHLHLERKVELIGKLDKEVSVCEDVMLHWQYWQQNVNPNKDDCCNLRFK